MTAPTRKKTCTACGQVLPLDDFGKKANTGDGRESRCRECRSAYYREWKARRTAEDKPEPGPKHKAGPRAPRLIVPRPPSQRPACAGLEDFTERSLDDQRAVCLRCPVAVPWCLHQGIAEAIEVHGLSWCYAGRTPAELRKLAAAVMKP